MNKLKSFLLLIIILNILSFAYSAQKNSIEDFAIYTADGKRKVFSEILSSIPDSGVLIVNFTSVTCRPCRKEIPELRELAMKYNDRARLICVYTEIGKPVQESAMSLGILSRAFVDPFGKIQILFVIKKIPVTVLIDKKRREICRFDGYTEENMKALEVILKEKKY